MKRMDQIQIGDKILPPARELRLWMRRDAQSRGIPEAEIYLTVTAIAEDQMTKRGRWLKITGNMSDRWNEDRQPYPFSFKAQPHTNCDLWK
jgi:hypothetical protein